MSLEIILIAAAGMLLALWLVTRPSREVTSLKREVQILTARAEVQGETARRALRTAQTAQYLAEGRSSITYMSTGTYPKHKETK